jgi:hypothetical protein
MRETVKGMNINRRNMLTRMKGLLDGSKGRMFRGTVLY